MSMATWASFFKPSLSLPVSASSILSSTCSCGCNNKHVGSLRAVKHQCVTAELKHINKRKHDQARCIQAALDALQGLAVYFLCLYMPGFALLTLLFAGKGNMLYSSSNEGDCTQRQWSAQVSRS